MKASPGRDRFSPCRGEMSPQVTKRGAGGQSRLAEPSQSKPDSFASSPEGGAFCHLPVSTDKAPPFGGAGIEQSEMTERVSPPREAGAAFFAPGQAAKVDFHGKNFWFPSGTAHFLFLRHTATPPATAAAMTTTGHAPARKTASCCTPCAKFCQPPANASAKRETKLSLGGE